MSLLMDALKRAEKARQAQSDEDAAKPLDPAETQGLSLDPLEMSRPLAAPQTGASDTATHRLEPPQMPATADPLDEPSVTATHRLDPPESSVTATHRLDPPEDPLAAGEGLSMAPLEETLPGTRGQRPLGEADPLGSARAGVDDVSIDDTAATLPSLKAAQASVDDYFDGTRSVSMSMEQSDLELEPAKTITAERNAARPPQDRTQDRTQDRDAVRAVFDAKAPSRRAPRQWASAGFLVLVLLAVVSGGVFAFWGEISELVGGQPAVVARKPFAQAGAPAAGTGAAEAPPAVAAAGGVPGPSGGARPSTAGAPGGTTAAMGQTTSQTAGQMSGAQTSGVQTSGETIMAQTAAPAQPVAQAPAQTAGTGETPMSGGITTEGPTPRAPSVAEVLDTRPQFTARSARPVGSEPRPAARASAPAAQIPVDELPLALRPGALDGGGALGSGSIRISRRATPARVPPLLEEGYRAYQAGDDDRARQAYEKVLAKEPNNRDAALGLAAVAVRTGQWNTAHDLYMGVLSRNPRDSVAMTGLLALTDNVDPQAASSRVKTLLSAEPRAAHLHFALGNLYARQERWPEAQEAYFNAHRYDDENADYAFNLAVSLDRLRQGKTALEYYRLALDLATRRPASFDTASVNERIRNMTAAGES